MPQLDLPFDWEAWNLEIVVYGSTLGEWLTAAVAFLVALLASCLVRWILQRRAAAFAERTRSDWDDALVEALQKTRWWFQLVLAAYCGSLFLNIQDETRPVLQSVTILALILQAAIWGNVLITSAVRRYIDRRMKDDPASVTMVSALALIGKLILFSILLLLALDNLGVDVTALIAGLGVGGIAVALAVQNILGDLLASLSIVFDRPFVLGDFILVGDQMGTVEKIGIKTTRLRSLSGEQLVFANNDLLQSRIRNFKRMQDRRIVFSVGVTYQTPHARLKQLPDVLREIVTAHEQTRFDRAHFKSFGDSALVFEVVYYVIVPDYNVYMDIQQSINLAVFERFEQLGVEFAYPTQTLFLEREQRDESPAGS